MNKNFITKFVITILLFFSFNLYTNGEIITEKNKYKQTIAIDLDGVLNNYQKYEQNNIPNIKEGAKDFLKELNKRGYKLILYTNRDNLLAVQWILNNNLENYFISVTNVKPKATIYIDDRAMKFNGNYEETLEEIEKFNVYWKDL